MQPKLSGLSYHHDDDGVMFNRFVDHCLGKRTSMSHFCLFELKSCINYLGNQHINEASFSRCRLITLTSLPSTLDHLLGCCDFTLMAVSLIQLGAHLLMRVYRSLQIITCSVSFHRAETHV